MEERQYTLEEIRQLMDVVGVARKNDPASTTLTAPALHGPFQGNTSQFGIFADYGPRPQRFSALVRPRSLARLLTLNRSIYHQEILEIMTGVTAASGTNATGWCGNPPTVGQGKVCQQTYSWGRGYVKTDLNAVPELGTLRSRAEVPAEILNSGPGENPLIPDIMYRMADPRSQLQYELWRIGVHKERSLEIVLARGNSTLASANTQVGWIAEFDGLDRLIKNGYTDAKTGVACPAADSAVTAFNAAVDGVIGGGDGRNVVEALTDLVWGIRDRAVSMGLDGTQWALVGRKELFRALVDVWACNYATYRCASTNAGEPYVNNVQDTNRLRLEMMSGQYILIDNMPVPFVFSEGVLQDSLGGNQFKSDLYMVPLDWNGLPLLRLEYFPMDNEYVQEFASFVDPEKIAMLNNGLYVAGYRDTGLCIEYHFADKMRLILETPFLAGRLDDIRYTFRAPIRNADPGDTWFYADGGATYRS